MTAETVLEGDSNGDKVADFGIELGVRDCRD
jgi:hypothetical protein